MQVRPFSHTGEWSRRERTFKNPNGFDANYRPGFGVTGVNVGDPVFIVYIQMSIPKKLLMRGTAEFYGLAPSATRIPRVQPKEEGGLPVAALRALSTP